MLGCLLVEPKIIDANLDRLTEKMFFGEKNGTIFRAIMDVYSNGDKVDVAIILHRLKNTEVTAVDLSRLQEVGFTPNADSYINKLEALSKKRDSAIVLNKAENELKSGVEDVEGWLVEQQDRFAAVGQSGRPPDIKTSEAMDQALTLIEQAKEGKICGYPWPMPEVTRATRGLEPGRTYTIGGLKKAGKTRWLVNTLFGLARLEVPVLFFSLEMSRQSIMEWLYAWYCDIDTAVIGTPYLSQKQMEKIKAYTPDIKQNICQYLFIDDRVALSPAQIIARSRVEKARSGVGVVAIDYLQRMSIWTHRTENRATAIGKAVNRLADMAKENELAVIILSQLRNIAEGNRPSVADLKESGGIAEGVDVVMLMDPHNRHTNRKGERDMDNKRIDIIIDVARNVESGVIIRTIGELECCKFKPLTEGHSDVPF